MGCVMKTLTYDVLIEASPAVVWQTMLDDQTYRQWVKAFSADSYYDGVWEQGAEIRFLDPNLGGTKAVLEQVEPHRRILARHVALVDKEGNESSSGAMADSWIGSTEAYEFEPVDGATRLRVTVQTHQDFVEMFDAGWPAGLAILKTLCETVSSRS